MEPDWEHLKKEINNFLWTNLPGSLDIAKAEKIAVKLFDDIKKEYDKLPTVSGPI